MILCCTGYHSTACFKNLLLQSHLVLVCSVLESLPLHYLGDARTLQHNQHPQNLLPALHYQVRITRRRVSNHLQTQPFEAARFVPRPDVVALCSRVLRSYRILIPEEAGISKSGLPLGSRDTLPRKTDQAHQEI